MPSLFEDYGAQQPPLSSDETRRMRLRLDAHLARQQVRRRQVLWAGALAATVVVGVAAGLVLTRAPEPPSSIVSATQGPERVPLPANGQLELEAGGRAVLSTGLGADVELLDGAVTLQVHRAPGARWVVRVDGYSVEALGTRFRVMKTGARPEVVVYEGVVRVRGPGLPEDGVTMTTAPPVEAPVEQAAPSPDVRDPPPPAPPTPSPNAAPRWLPKFRDLLQRGDLEAAVRVIPPGFPAEASGATAKDLLDAGDLLAAAGEQARAEASYSRVCGVARGEGPCGLSQVRLAIARGTAGDPAAALSWASRYLTANPTGVFAPEMTGRSMSWRLARGQMVEAREAAQELLERWPDSKPWAAQARELLKAP